MAIACTRPRHGQGSQAPVEETQPWAGLAGLIFREIQKDRRMFQRPTISGNFVM
jgi:hypothetical protein